MLKLPQITLVALTNKNIPAHEEAIRKSCEGIEWGAVKLIVDYKCTSIDIWNYKILYELHNYVDTEFAMLIHADSEIVHPEKWNNDWLNYDYCGSPWPLPKDDYSYRTPSGKLVRVGNSVGLRSKKLMELAASTPKEYFWSFKEKYGNSNEDGYISCHIREFLEENGCKFMPFEEAIYFGKEHELPENQGVDTFLVHEVG